MNDLFKKNTDSITEEDIKNAVCSFVERVEPCLSDENLVEKILKPSDSSSSHNTE